MMNNTNPEGLKIAKNPNTPADLLRELAALTSDEVVKARISSNPNTPPDLLVELAGECLEEIGENPALELILMENPNFIENIFDRLEDWIYCYPEPYLPLWYLEKARKHSNCSLRCLVASSKHTPISFLKELIKDPNPFVRSNVIKHKKFSIFRVIRYILDREEMVRESALERLDLNEPGSLYALLVSVIAILLAGFKCLQIFFFSQ